MTNHPSRSTVATARRAARAAGYYVIDHRPVGWRIGLEGYPTFEDRTNRFDTASEAWVEAARMAQERAASDNSLTSS